MSPGLHREKDGKMDSQGYLRYLVDEIHTVIVATVDEDGLPVTAAIDMMDCDEGGLYFLTARGKGLYDRLTRQGFVALTALKGEDTMSSVSISVRGRVRELGSARIPELFEKNPYMYRIYSAEESRAALTVFQVFEGTGEWFDLSKRPIERASFTFGGAEEEREGYLITSACIGCGSCVEVCPQDCIVTDSIPYVIQQGHCLHCGNCLATCPAGAVERR